MLTMTAQPATILASNDSGAAQVAALASGNFVAVWATTDGTVQAQLFDALGHTLGAAIQVAAGLTPTGVAGLAAGGFVVELQQVAGQNVSVTAQAVDASGQLTGPPVTVATYAGSPFAPKLLGGTGILGLPGGGYVADVLIDGAGLKGFGGEHFQVNGHFFDANGHPLGQSGAPSNVPRFDAAVLANGDVAFASMDYSPGGRSGPGPFFDADSPGGLQFGAGPAALGVSAFSDAVVALANGDVVLAWQLDPTLADGRANQLQAQIFAPAPDPVTHVVPALTPVLTFTGDFGTTPDLTALAGGGFLLSWGGHFAQAFDALGQAISGVIQIGSQNIAATPDGGFVVLTQDGSNVVEQTYGFAAAPAPDVTAPTAIDFFPTAGSTTLPPDWNLGITFSEAVKPGAGTITLETSTGVALQTFVVASDPGIQFIGSTVVINPAADLQPGTTYQLVVAPDALTDLAGNAYAGESGYAFTTAGAAPAPSDTAPPVAIDFFPANGSNSLPPDWNIGITFNEAVKAGPGIITLQRADGATVQSFTGGNPGIEFIGSSVVLNPTADLQPGTTYRLLVAPGAVQDLAGNPFAGFFDGYTFTTAGAAPAPGDRTPPTAIDFFPAVGSNTLPPDWDFGITFSEAVKAGPGTITLETAAGQVVQTFAAASDPGIQFTGASVIINPAADLQPGATYTLVVGPNAVQDLAGNAYAGESSDTFTVALVGGANVAPV